MGLKALGEWRDPLGAASTGSSRDVLGLFLQCVTLRIVGSSGPRGDVVTREFRDPIPIIYPYT